MKIVENVQLALHTTFKIGGKAKFFGIANEIKDIKECVSFAKRKGVPLFVLGGGTNILISKDELPFFVIKNEICGIKYNDLGNHFLVSVGAGENWDEFVADTVLRELWGLENLSGIPGTVGAAPIQNIGAYGVEVGETIEKVEAIDLRTGLARVFNNAECNFTYRNSFFKSEDGRNFCVTLAVFRLSKEARPNLLYKDVKEYFLSNSNPSIKDIRKAIISIRSKKFPDLALSGTAGSFWKNPIISEEKYMELKQKYPDLPSFELPIRLVPTAGRFERVANDQPQTSIKIPLAFILDKVCNLKGYSIGRARLFEKQPLVVVTESGATFRDVENLMLNVEKKVFDTVGISIEREVCVI